MGAKAPRKKPVGPPPPAPPPPPPKSETPTPVPPSPPAVPGDTPPDERFVYTFGFTASTPQGRAAAASLAKEGIVAPPIKIKSAAFTKD